MASEDNSSINTSVSGTDISNQEIPEPNMAQLGPAQRAGRVSVNPPVSNGFRYLKPLPPRGETWASQVDRAERAREQTKSVTDTVDVTNSNINKQKFVEAAANAAAKAEALRVQAEKAKNDADLLRQMAEVNDTVELNGEPILIREYSDLSLKSDQHLAMPNEEFASILAKLDQLSIKQLKIISSAVTSLLGSEVQSTPQLLNTGKAEPCFGGAPNASQTTGTYAGAVTGKNQQPVSNRSRKAQSKIRANPIQGGVRVNLDGARIDYDNHIYIDPSGKRFRMQLPRPKSADRLKAESQLQTVVRRLKALANANGISRECQPVAGSDLAMTYNQLLDDLSAAKLRLKEVKAKDKSRKTQTN